MGADLFGSYVATILATMVLGREIQIFDDGFNSLSENGMFQSINFILLPMIIAGLGLIFSIVGSFFVRIKKESGSVQNALNVGNWLSIILTLIASYFVVNCMLPDGYFSMKTWVFSLDATRFFKSKMAIFTGLVVGGLMSIITEYYTLRKKTVNSIVNQSSTGHATNIIGGLAVGMESTVLPILVLAGGIFVSFQCAGLYGVLLPPAWWLPQQCS